MSDGNKLLTKAYSIRGADMGRPTITDDPNAKVRLFRVRFYDGDYDRGGAYWGGSSPLYAAIGEGFQAFVRKPDREQAKSALKARYPGLRFYR